MSKMYQKVAELIRNIIPLNIKSCTGITPAAIDLTLGDLQGQRSRSFWTLLLTGFKNSSPHISRKSLVD